MNFQILTDDEILDTLVLRYEFSAPIRTLVYLNTKTLMEPDHQIIHTIAAEIAHYILKQKKTQFSEENVDDLLIKWGFGQEIDAARCDQEISQSEGFKIGYDWAKKQNHDYLMQHFGLYFDQWNDKGLGAVSDKEFDRQDHKGQTVPALEDILPSKKLGFLESDIGKVPDSASVRKNHACRDFDGCQRSKSVKRTCHHGRFWTGTFQTAWTKFGKDELFASSSGLPKAMHHPSLPEPGITITSLSSSNHSAFILHIAAP